MLFAFWGGFLAYFLKIGNWLMGLRNFSRCLTSKCGSCTPRIKTIPRFGARNDFFLKPYWQGSLAGIWVCRFPQRVQPNTAGDSGATRVGNDSCFLFKVCWDLLMKNCMRRGQVNITVTRPRLYPFTFHVKGKLVYGFNLYQLWSAVRATRYNPLWSSDLTSAARKMIKARNRH